LPPFRKEPPPSRKTSRLGGGPCAQAQGKAKSRSKIRGGIIRTARIPLPSNCWVCPSELRKVPQILSILATPSTLFRHNVSTGISVSDSRVTVGRPPHNFGWRSSSLRPVCFPAAAPYPNGTGRAAIRRTMLPKRRRVSPRQRSLPTTASNTGLASPASAASWSYTKIRRSRDATTAATSCPSYRRSRSATGALRWIPRGWMASRQAELVIFPPRRVIDTACLPSLIVGVAASAVPRLL